MSENIDPERQAASVLVVAADPNIESLLGELVAFAGYRPMFDVTAGACGESIRRSRPDIALLDVGLPSPVVEACIAAADEVGCSSVLMSSTSSGQELAEQARAKGTLYFPLPGGPKPLARILDRAMARRTPRPPIKVPEVGKDSDSGSVHPAVRAALSSVARAALRARVEDRRSDHALRAAITDYAKQLKAAAVPIEAGVSLVQETIRDCACFVGAEAAVPSLLLQSADWARKAYGAM